MKTKITITLFIALFYSALGFGQLIGEKGELRVGQGINSPNGQYRLQLQTDGNLVIYKKVGNQFSEPIWSTNTHDKTASILKNQEDGNLVLYGSNNNVLFSTSTHNFPHTRLQFQNDGNLVIYGWGDENIPVWASMQGHLEEHKRIRELNFSEIKMPRKEIYELGNDRGWKRVNVSVNGNGYLYLSGTLYNKRKTGFHSRIKAIIKDEQGKNIAEIFSPPYAINGEDLDGRTEHRNVSERIKLNNRVMRKIMAVGKSIEVHYERVRKDITIPSPQPLSGRYTVKKQGDNIIVTSKRNVTFRVHEKNTYVPYYQVITNSTKNLILSKNQWAEVWINGKLYFDEKLVNF
ncbi:MAG: hypothetical protein Aureis2KO_32500 [Aureisphaera sp.]